MEFANKTQLVFEPGLSNSVAVDAVALAYQTPQEFRERLGDLARLSYLVARFKYRVELSGSSSAGAATVKLMAGVIEVCAQAIDLSSGTTFRGAMDADINTLAGAADLSIVLDVTTAADASVAAQVAGVLEVVHPIVFAVS